MTGLDCELRVETGRTYSEAPQRLAPAKRLRVIQLGSFPARNRGARANLLTIHERLLAAGHESVVIDLTRSRRVKQPGVFYARSATELARLLLNIPADVVHLHIGSALTIRKLALAAIVNKLPETKTICTLHLGGHFYPKKGLRAWRRGPTAMVLRQFDRLIAINPEIAGFFKRIGIDPGRMNYITPFPRVQITERSALSGEVETFCREHTPLIASVNEFELGFDLARQSDILSKVRERYPRAGLIAVGGGSPRSQCSYESAFHQDCNHVKLAGRLTPGAKSELIRRANVFLRTEDGDEDALWVDEELRARTLTLDASNGRSLAAFSVAVIDDVETSAEQVLRMLQPATPPENSPATLRDGVEDVIRLYKEIVTPAAAPPVPLPSGYEWPNSGWPPI